MHFFISLIFKSFVNSDDVYLSNYLNSRLRKERQFDTVSKSSGRTLLGCNAG